MMSVDQLTRFIKLMGMTGSSFDGEALNALRMATSILNEAGHNWEELIRGRVTVERPQQASMQSNPYSNRKVFRDAEEIDECFKILLEGHLSESFRKFVESVHDWWLKNHYLTEAQYKAIRSAAERQL